MGFDASIVWEKAGILRIGGIVAGILAWVFGVIGEFPIIGPQSWGWKIVYYWSVLLCTVIGLTLLSLGLFGKLDNERVQVVDKVYHALAPKLLVLTSLSMLFGESGWVAWSGFFGLISGLFCTGMAYLLFKPKDYEY